MFPLSAVFSRTPGGVYNQEMANAEFNAVTTRVNAYYRSDLSREVN